MPIQRQMRFTRRGTGRVLGGEEEIAQVSYQFQVTQAIVNIQQLGDVNGPVQHVSGSISVLGDAKLVINEALVLITEDDVRLEFLATRLIDARTRSYSFAIQRGEQQLGR